jgi:rare lipoprotein A (peptidoglycan hydrolase)
MSQVEARVAMRRPSLILLTFVVALPLLAGPLSGTALADPSLTQAKSDRDRAVAAVHDAERRVAELQKRYLSTRKRLDAAARDVLQAYRERLALSARLAEMRQILNRRAAAFYEAGPALSLELLLASRDWADVNAVQAYTRRTLALGAAMLVEISTAKVSLSAVAIRLERRQAALTATARTVEALTAEMRAELTAAQQQAAKAGLKVQSLEKRQRELARAASSTQADLDDLIHAEHGVDQSTLLALLGPNQGRGCAIPGGLKETGVHLSGLSSWYGPGFAGRPTASGAIYDPRLFTAANKELPLNVFLRVHHDGRCAIVLVNDRGPYIAGRFLDLSQASAEYLGVTLSHVTADVLVPR